MALPRSPRSFRSSTVAEREGQFNAILVELRHLATQRNEVAHGIVQNVQHISAFTRHFVKDALGKPQYLLKAPYYQLKQHASDDLPAFATQSRPLRPWFPRWLALTGGIYEFCFNDPRC